MIARVIEGMDMREYLSAPGLSAGVLTTLLDECPAAALFAYESRGGNGDADDGSDAGSIGHSILLEQSEACVAVIEADDWRTKAAKEAREIARASGKTPILAHKLPIIRAMVKSAGDFISELRAEEPAVWAAFQPDGGKSEVTVLWDDDGTPCKLRVDRLSSDARVAVDAKFTGQSAEPDAYSRSRISEMAIRAAWYRRGIKAAFETVPEYLFLVTQQSAPFLSSLIGVEPALAAYGDAEVERGLAVWRHCLASGEWPGYPRRVAYPSAPAWLMARAEDRAIEGDIFRERAHPPLSWPERQLLGTQA